uniref:Pinin-like n=1 Tax=Dermatophagoides pteronyssinus TaxID=6956 RepID=A0A6P6Y9H8_DERPT
MNLFEKLESSYNLLEKSLIDIDDNIKKITGKDPNRSLFDDNGRNNNNQRSSSFRQSSSFAGNKRKLNEFGGDDHFNVDNDDNEIQYKRSLQSQVVATSWEMKHRNQVLEEQKLDKKSMSRNRRMFGHILGTLEKFKNEQSQRKDLQKRAEIEQKLDQADEQEREQLKNEREKLFKERTKKRLQMKCLEMKLQRAEIHKKWEQSQQYLGNFIETKVKPNIFYMPAKHTPETLKRSQETKDKYRIIFAEKRAKIQKELNEIDELYRINNDDEDDDNVENNLAKAANENELKIHSKDLPITTTTTTLNDNRLIKDQKESSNNSHVVEKKNGHFNQMETIRNGRKSLLQNTTVAAATSAVKKRNDDVHHQSAKIEADDKNEIKTKEIKNSGHHHQQQQKHSHHHRHHH